MLPWPTEEELLEEFLLAVDLLTINDEFRLRKRVEFLEIEKSRIDDLEAKIMKLEKRHVRIR